MASETPPPDDQKAPRSNLRRSGRAPIVIVLLALAAGGIWFATRTRGPGDAPPPTAPPPVAPAAPEAAPEPEAAPVEADPADVKALLEAASPDPRYRSWLAQGDLVRRAAVVIANLAEGVSPRAELAFLAPRDRFSTVQREDGTFIAPEAYARYDGFADAIASLDPGVLAKAWHALRPAVQTAYRALGTGGSVDAALGRALVRLETATVREEPVRVEEDDGVFVYADEKLEALDDVEKHLLRMGPRNTRLLQEKARALREAIGLQPGSAGRPAAR